MNDWVGLTVGEVLKRAGVEFRDVTFIDEPPGKLCALRFPYRSDELSGKVTLEMQYQPKLFSSERQWPQSLVEAQPVTQVHWDPDQK